MSKTEKPSIRFHGFDDTWEQRKLGDNIAEYTEKTTINNQYPVLTSSRRGIFFQTDYYDGNQIASADNTGYNIVPYDILHIGICRMMKFSILISMILQKTA